MSHEVWRRFGARYDRKGAYASEGARKTFRGLPLGGFWAFYVENVVRFVFAKSATYRMGMTGMSKQRLARASAILVLGASSLAHAGGYEIPENTTRALGRGGANFASVRDASATYFNPAALANVDGFSFSGGLNLPMQFARFDRADLNFPAQNSLTPNTVKFDRARNELGLLPAPMLFFSHDFGLKNTTFGFALYGPSAVPSAKWGSADGDADSPDFMEATVTRGGTSASAYQLVASNLLVVYPSLSVGHKFEEIGLSIGGALQLAYARTDVTVGLEGTTGVMSIDDASVRNPSNPSGVLFEEDPAAYVEARVVTQGVGITANFGLLYEPSPSLAIGLSYRPAHKVKMKGKLDILESPGLAAFDLRLKDDTARMAIVMPHVLRAGINYRHIVDGFEVLDVELAATYEMWSIVNSLVARAPGPIDSIAFTDRTIADVNIPFNFKNTVSLRVGGDFNGMRDRQTGEGLALRGGLFWESNGSPKEYSNLYFMPFQRVGLTGGLSYYFENVSLDLGLMWLHGMKRTVSNGDFDVINPLWVCLDPGSVENTTEAAVQAACAANGSETPYHAVNNGTYQSDIVTISAGLTWNW